MISLLLKIDTHIYIYTYINTSTTTVANNRPRGTTPNKVAYQQNIQIQQNDLEIGIAMAKNLRGKINKNQKSQKSWLVTTIKNLLRRPIKDPIPPVFSLKQTQSSAQQKSNILTTFNGYFGEAIKYQLRIYLE